MPTRNPEWDTLELLLDQLLDATPRQREQILGELQHRDPSLAKRVAKLLELALSDDAGPDSVNSVAPAFIAALTHDDIQAHIGEKLGPFRIVSLIQRGGMGAVFRAERADGAFEQTVAIKLIPESVAGTMARQMFERERGHLARLEHPNIARIIDAGVTQYDTPYYVLEYIEGDTIDVALSGCSTRDVLTYFLQLCDAVAYCHRSLIVHGDIKPANVLVADNRVRLIDFGIGRLVDEPADEQKLKRLHAFSRGFASPEQLIGDAIDVRSDVFSLGALLRSVLSKTNGGRLPDDLLSILDRCQANDANNRYESVDALRIDIRAFQNNYPVSAHKSASSYRLAKFVRRNRLPTAAAIAVFLSIGVGVTTTYWQYQEARTQAVRAEQVKTFLTSLFERADSSVAGERDVTLRELVDEAAMRLKTELHDVPEVQNEVRGLLGNAYYGVGQFQKSFALHEQALTNLLMYLDPPNLEIVRALNALGLDYRERGEYQLAINLHREALAQLQALDLPQSTEAWESWTRLGYALKEVDPTAGTEAFQKAHDIVLAIRPSDTAAIARSLGRLASGLRAEGEIEKAVVVSERAVAIAESNNEFLAPEIISIRCALALDYGTLGRYDDAYKDQKLCIDQTRERLGATHPWNVWYLNNLGALDLRKGRLAEAEKSFSAARSIASERLPERSIGRLAAEINYAVVLWQSGKIDGVAKQLQGILQKMEESVGAAHPSSARIRSILGRVLLETGDIATATRFLENSIVSLSDDWLSDALLWTAEANLAAGDNEAAALHAGRSLAYREENAKFTSWQVAEASYVLARASNDLDAIRAAKAVFDRDLPARHFRRR